jgi:hypothetical protein
LPFSVVLVCIGVLSVWFVGLSDRSELQIIESCMIITGWLLDVMGVLLDCSGTPEQETNKNAPIITFFTYFLDAFANFSASALVLKIENRSIIFNIFAQTASSFGVGVSFTIVEQIVTIPPQIANKSTQCSMIQFIFSSFG